MKNWVNNIIKLDIFIRWFPKQKDSPGFASLIFFSPLPLVIYSKMACWVLFFSFSLYSILFGNMHFQLSVISNLIRPLIPRSASSKRIQ